MGIRTNSDVTVKTGKLFNVSKNNVVHGFFTVSFTLFCQRVSFIWFIHLVHHVCMYVQVRAIDMPMRFPQLHFTSTGSSLESCDVVCSNADPRDLDAVAYALKRGYR